MRRQTLIKGDRSSIASLALCTLVFAMAAGCPPVSDCVAQLVVRGRFSVQSNEPAITESHIGASLLADGAVFQVREPGAPEIVPSPDGSFEIFFDGGALGPCPPPPFPRLPDEVKFTIVWPTCTVNVVVGAELGVVSTPNSIETVLEFRNPIQVPSCEE